MIRTFGAAAGAAAAFGLLAFLPSAYAQTPGRYDAQDFGQPTIETSVYGSFGFAWSGEVALELELGAQIDVGNVLELRFSPLNVALFDGDYIYDDGYYSDDYSCDEDDLDDVWHFTAFCDTEVDSEWRSVAEAQLKLTPTFSLGAGASYLLQGDFKPEDGRVSTFLSLATTVEDGSTLELRAGREYIALRVAGKW